MPDLDDPPAEDVEEFAVVRDREDRARIPEQVVLEPSERFEIEVVRRLVEQEQVRLLDQQAREVRAHHPPAAQLVDRTKIILLAKCQPRQNPLRRRLRAAIRLVPGRKLHDRSLGRSRGLLRKIPATHAALDADRPLVRFVRPQQQRKKRRLPGPVRPDQPDPVAGIDLQRRLLKKGATGKRLADTENSEHRKSATDSRPGNPLPAYEAALKRSIWSLLTSSSPRRLRSTRRM